MNTRFACPQCGQHISSTPEQGGMAFQCPGCGNLLTVPTVAIPLHDLAPLHVLTNKKSRWKPILIALVLILYPICFFGGCSFGMFKAMNLSGGVVITDGLLATNFVEMGGNVHLALVNNANEAPPLIVVDFHDADTGTMIQSETVAVEHFTNGSSYFAFNFPKEFTDSSNKHITATVRTPHLKW